MKPVKSFPTIRCRFLLTENILSKTANRLSMLFNDFNDIFVAAILIQDKNYCRWFVLSGFEWVLSFEKEYSSWWARKDAKITICNVRTCFFSWFSCIRCYLRCRFIRSATLTLPYSWLNSSTQLRYKSEYYQIL